MELMKGVGVILVWLDKRLYRNAIQFVQQNAGGVNYIIPNLTTSPLYCEVLMEKCKSSERIRNT